MLYEVITNIRRLSCITKGTRRFTYYLCSTNKSVIFLPGLYTFKEKIMIYLADTADIEALRQLYDFFPLQGVTTNPTILKQSGLKLSEAIQTIADIVGEGTIHVQVLSNQAEEMVKEAKKYKTYFDLGDNFHAKIPVSIEGYKARNNFV